MNSKPETYLNFVFDGGDQSDIFVLDTDAGNRVIGDIFKAKREGINCVTFKDDYGDSVFVNIDKILNVTLENT